MLLNLVSAGSAYPVTLDEAKAQLRVDTNDEVQLIGGLITAASEAVEEMAGRDLTPKTYDLSMNGASGKVRLPKTPVSSITSISYFDRDNAPQTATVSDFYLFGDEFCYWMEPKPNVVWPSTYDRADALTIRFVAGYGTSTPTVFKQAILMLISHWFEQRESVSEKLLREVPFSVSSLVGLHKKGWVGA